MGHTADEIEMFGWVPLEIDTSMNGIVSWSVYFDSATATVTNGIVKLPHPSLHLFMTSHGYSIDNLDPDSYCKSKGYNGATSSCKIENTYGDSQEAFGSLMANNIPTYVGLNRWGYACKWGEIAIYEVPSHILCYK